MQATFSLPGFQIIYIITVLVVIIKVILDNRATSEALAYIMLITFVPFFGMIFYFSFGIHYRKNKFYRFKIQNNQAIYDRTVAYAQRETKESLEDYSDLLLPYQSTINYLINTANSPLLDANEMEVLKNGERKFEKVLEVLQRAKHHIHLEYYIFTDDHIGRKIADLLKAKAKAGVGVRFLYDAFGSRISRAFHREMEAAGVEIQPVNKLRFRLFANRINYRDHRKIIVVDGKEGFVGGINIKDEYINYHPEVYEPYWRDTHLYINGPGVIYLQYLFFSNWIHNKEKMLDINSTYFPMEEKKGKGIVQIAAGGPDSELAITHSTLSLIMNARTRLYITTPYFIPPDTILIALKHATASGVDVRMIVPEKSDSRFVNAAAFSYYQEVLEAGIRVYLYQRGFVHAKTMLVDDTVAVIGTANMDTRSHELNFEVNAIAYDQDLNKALYDDFLEDLKECKEIDLATWSKRSILKVFFEHLARLFSPVL